MKLDFPQSKKALFGGSFDPPHRAHLAIAAAAVAQCGLEEVVFLPCRQSPHKTRTPGATGHQRTKMLELATEDLPWATVSTWELDQPGPSYSWRTAEEFSSRESTVGWHWLMGFDQWEALPRWNEPGRLSALVTFIVFPREGGIPQQRPGVKAHFLHGEFPGSSTEVRAVTACGGTSPLLVPAVADYIARHGLYAAPPGD